MKVELTMPGLAELKELLDKLQSQVSVAKNTVIKIENRIQALEIKINQSPEVADN